MARLLFRAPCGSGSSVLSGICGIVHRDGGPAGPDDLARMLGALEHRGRDGSGQWSAGPAAFGHQMLRTTPESQAEHQPLERDGLVLVADARLDNRDELLSAVEVSPGDSPTDSDLILAAYRTWGEETPRHLLGDFAFAIWDADARRLVCVRDQLGVKPFYYASTGSLYAFASEIKGILAMPGISRELDEQRVGDYLVTLFEDAEATFYGAVRRIPPAHVLSVTPERLTLKRYWALDPNRELTLGSDQEYEEAFRETLRAAIHCRLRSASRAGCMLSGGLDSSAVVCLARELRAKGGQQDPLPTFSAVFETVPESDERRYIEALVAQGGLEPHYVAGDELSPLREAERVLWHQDEPFYTPNLFLDWALMRAARDEGVVCLLTGVDGDSVVSHGLSRVTELAARGHWLKLSREVEAVSKVYFEGTMSAKAVLRTLVMRPLIPEWAFRARRALRRSGPVPRPPQFDAIRDDFERRLGLEDRYRELRGERARLRSRERHEHWRRLTWPLIPFVFEKLDRTAAAFGVEPRHPFYDRRMVELCLSLPAEQKLRAGLSRSIERRSLAPLYPPEIRERRSKADLGYNFHRGLVTDDRERVEALLADPPPLLERYIDLPILRQRWDAYVGTRSTRGGLAVWPAILLAQWLKGLSAS